MSWWQNPWVINLGTGIPGSIISGYIVWRITNRRENKAHLQRVENANKEIIHSIRPSVAEAVIPSLDVMEAVVAAAARRHGVREAELFGVAEVCDLLIDEIMSNPFLSAKQKGEFCEQLVGRKKQAGKKRNTNSRGPKSPGAGPGMLSLVMAISAVLFTLLSALDLSSQIKEYLNNSPLVRVAVIIGIGILMPIFSMILAYISRQINDLKDEREYLGRFLSLSEDIFERKKGHRRIDGFRKRK